MKIATIEDLDVVTRLATNFSKTITQSSIVSLESLETLIKAFLTSSVSEKIILLHGEVGMLAASIQPYLLGTEPIAHEVAWWVEPDHRKSNVGRELVQAYEYWAQKLNCKYIVMSCYADNDVGNFYEKLGYSLHEKAYLKELT